MRGSTLMMPECNNRICVESRLALEFYGTDVVPTGCGLATVRQSSMAPGLPLVGRYFTLGCAAELLVESSHAEAA
jgi:hypothetical protein